MIYRKHNGILGVGATTPQPKFGLISREAKLVFIGSLGGKRLVGESRKPGGKGHLRGRQVPDLSANCGH